MRLNIFGGPCPVGPCKHRRPADAVISKYCLNLLEEKWPEVLQVEDYRVHIEHKRKWSQPPVEIDPGPPPTYYGWDEMSIYGGMQIAGDDWLCEDQRPVSDIHWWGSYYGWDIPEPHPIRPHSFHIGIWTDVPAGVDLPYSHPGWMVWEYWATMAEVNEQWVGYDFHEQHLPDACFKYELQLPEEQWFWQEGGETVYWLTISALYDVQPPLEYWGWKTRPHNYNDDAIRILMPTAPMLGMDFIMGEPILESWDLAFELTTWECMPNPGQTADPVGTAISDSPEASGSTTYAEWVAAGYPKCWCYQAQCRGNSDGFADGSSKTGYYQVGATDLNTLMAGWQVMEPPIGAGAANVISVDGIPGICANFNRMKDGSSKTGYYHVGANDLNRLMFSWQVYDPGVPLNDCGGNLIGPYPGP